ncbi:hypothetical protein ACFX1X_032248 [Malus domestica]
MDHENGAVVVKMLSDDFDPTARVVEPLPPVVTSTDDCYLIGKLAKDHKGSREKQMVLGRNMHTMCLTVMELGSNDDFTGDKKAYMASVLACYRKTLIERTKHHLGYSYNLDFDYGALT